MAGVKNFIDFTLITGDDEIRIRSYTGEYADLRLLIREYVSCDDFGQCGGMGRCATCMVTVSSNIRQERKIPVSLLSKNYKRPVKLSCQLTIDDDLANKYIRILPARDGDGKYRP